MSALEQAALDFAKARLERKQAKRALQSWFAYHWSMNESYPCEHGEVGCFRTCNEQGEEIPKDEWCDLCKERQPLYDAYQQAQHKQGVALRRLDRIASKQLTTEAQL